MRRLESLLHKQQNKLGANYSHSHRSVAKYNWLPLHHFTSAFGAFAGVGAPVLPCALQHSHHKNANCHLQKTISSYGKQWLTLNDPIKKEVWTVASASSSLSLFFLILTRWKQSFAKQYLYQKCFIQQSNCCWQALDQLYIVYEDLLVIKKCR